MCLSGNSLRGFEETSNVQSVCTHAASVGGDSKVWVAGVEVGDFGVCAPAGVGGAGIAQVVVSEAGLAARQIELAREFVCQGFLMEVAMLLRQVNGGIIMFARFCPTAFDTGTFRFDQMELVQEVHRCGLSPAGQSLLVNGDFFQVWRPGFRGGACDNSQLYERVIKAQQGRVKHAHRCLDVLCGQRYAVECTSGLPKQVLEESTVEIQPENGQQVVGC